MKKTIFVNWHNNTNLFNGPVNVFNNLQQGLKKYNYEDVKIVSPEAYGGDFNKAVSYLSREILFSKKNVFIVNGNGLKMPYVVFLLSLFNRRNKYYLISHGLRIREDNYAGINKKTYYILERILIRNFKNIIAVSKLLKNHITESYNRMKPVDVVYCGMDIDESYKVEKLSIGNDIRIIMSGGIKNIKGIIETLDLVECINTSNKPYKVYLDIFGGYDNDDLYKQVIDKIENKLSPFISYKKSVSKEELLNAYGKYHFSIALSHSDTFNMSVAESVLCGTPSIISTNCGISEVLENFKHGFIVDMSEDYLKLIENFLDNVYINGGIYDNMRFECIKMDNKIGLKNMVDKYMEVGKS